MPGLEDRPVDPSKGYGKAGKINKGSFPEVADGNDTPFTQAAGKKSLENFPIPENGTIGTTWNGDGLAKNTTNNETA